MNIRPANRDDVDGIRTIYNQAILTTTATFDLEPKTIEDRMQWFESHGPRHPIMVAETENQIVGWACLSPWNPRAAYQDTAESSVYVRESFRSRGIGRRLKAAITSEAVRLGYRSLIAGVAEGSDASMHLNKSFGFEVVGTFRDVGEKFGRLLDVTYLQKVLKPTDNSDPLPD